MHENGTRLRRVVTTIEEAEKAMNKYLDTCGASMCSK
jgi:hypothetical protein